MDEPHNRVILSEASLQAESKDLTAAIVAALMGATAQANHAAKERRARFFARLASFAGSG
jgi:hypothetical protein